MQLGTGLGPLQWLTLLSVIQWGQEAPHPAVNFHLGQRRGAANPEVCFYFSPTFQSRSQSRGVVYNRTLNKVKENKIPLLAFILNCLGQMASYREREKEGIHSASFPAGGLWLLLMTHSCTPSPSPPLPSATPIFQLPSYLSFSPVSLARGRWEEALWWINLQDTLSRASHETWTRHQALFPSSEPCKTEQTYRFQFF